MNEPGKAPMAPPRDEGADRHVLAKACETVPSWVELAANPRSAHLWAQMQQHWATDGRIRVEECFTPDEIAACDEPLLLDLIYCEFCLRHESGESPTLDEYLMRYPTLERPLRRQFAVHQGLVELFGGCSMVDQQTEDPPITEPRTQLPITVGKYRVVQLLGSGSQADVYRAAHPLLGRDVVVKRYRQIFPNDPRGNRFLSEGRLLAQLSHPNLVQIYDAGFEQRSPYLVMEYVSGETLEQYARHSTFAPVIAARVVAKIARAVSAVHKAGITHRDIKPANIVVDSNGEPHLLDFGISQIVDVWNPVNVEDTKISGTLGYMAPEQARGEAAAIDHRTDIFALGGVLFFLLTGKPPYSGDCFSSTLSRVRECRWDREALQQCNAPRRLRSICEKAMASAGEDRYPTADGMARDLEVFASRTAAVRKSLLVGVVALLVVGIAAVSVPKAWFPSGSQAKAPALAKESVGAQPLSELPSVIVNLNLTVQIWRNGRFFHLAEVAPVYPGDEFRITAELPAGFHGSLFLVNSRGEIQFLTEAAAGQSSVELRYPTAEGHAVPLIGSPGTEFLFVVGRKSAAIDRREIEVAWASSERLPALPDQTVLELRGDRLHAVQRSRDFGAPVLRPDPEDEIKRRLDGFRERIQVHVDWIEGIVYSHKRSP